MGDKESYTATEPRRRARLVRRVGMVASLSLVLLFALYGTARLMQSKGSSAQLPPLEKLGAIPSFALTSQHGGPYGSEDMRGSVTIANFIFTRCPTICPVFTLKMRRVLESTDERIKLVSFSVDPEYDTPEVLRQYAVEQQAESPRWTFLTGEFETIRKTVEEGLKISMARKGVDEQGVPDIVHGTHFVLIDPEGTIRGYYDSDLAERIKDLKRDAKRLLAEQASAK